MDPRALHTLIGRILKLSHIALVYQLWVIGSRLINQSALTAREEQGQEQGHPQADETDLFEPQKLHARKLAKRSGADQPVPSPPGGRSRVCEELLN
jgi:hypothetical protein